MKNLNLIPQSKSNPSNLYFYKNGMMLSTKVLRVLGLDAISEYLEEPSFQPPMAINAFNLELRCLRPEKRK
jgi:hypothetical protein